MPNKITLSLSKYGSCLFLIFSFDALACKDLAMSDIYKTNLCCSYDCTSSMLRPLADESEFYHGFQITGHEKSSHIAELHVWRPLQSSKITGLSYGWWDYDGEVTQIVEKHLKELYFTLINDKLSSKEIKKIKKAVNNGYKLQKPFKYEIKNISCAKFDLKIYISYETDPEIYTKKVISDDGLHSKDDFPIVFIIERSK